MLEHPLNDQYDTLLCQSIIQEILLHLLLLLCVFSESHRLHGYITDKCF